MSKFGIGVVGCGSIAEIAHFPSIRKTPDAQLVSVCDLDPQRAKSTAQKWGASRWYSDHNKMFADGDEVARAGADIIRRAHAEFSRHTKDNSTR